MDMTGRYPKTFEHRQKLSAALKGRKLSPETRQKMSEARKGRKLTQEWKENISKGRTGKHFEQLARENNPRWKGGRWTRKDGYVFVLSPGHPHANENGYVREHILVMTKHLGRALNPGEVVHHVNGDRGDNHLENLVVMTRAGHASEHHKGVHKPNSEENLRKYNEGRRQK
jgi:hypothetical protein